MTTSQAVAVLLRRVDTIHIDRALGRTFVTVTCPDGSNLVESDPGPDLNVQLERLLARTTVWSMSPVVTV